MSLNTSLRCIVAIGLVLSAGVPVSAAREPQKPKRKKDPKAWIDGKDVCSFPFAEDKLPATADGFAAAMERGYRSSLKLPKGASVVVARGGTYPTVDTLRIDVRDAVVDSDKEARKPSSRQRTIHGLDAGHFELLGRGMNVDNAKVNVGMTATDARLLFTRDREGRPLLVLGGAREGRMTVDLTHGDLERLLLAGARKALGPYGVTVQKTRLKMTVEDEGRTVRVHLKLETRAAGFIPAGLHFRARVDIDERLNGRLSQLNCTGDDVLGPLIGGIIHPFLKKYEGTTRPVMNFPRTDIRLRDVQIAADNSVRIAAEFGS